ncbi:MULTISPECIES: peptide chain release factor N(5)-glutamine methyltransferase [Lactobacillaceae]|uniref:peptide chain release factor N(5)-glutamine methyltransferase n=1 Tax=Lactobacillaceae TaxID=33958 RepID=UPI0014574372|nr:peptide chain release factor N(5)-glutamine methyltransferase [Lactobacillus sp. HBUAS51381]NLR08743.1 peptide chain release factor N(5)-glutamine methyltransferase [Lactobacillus sp. HBUAS51381]
MAKQPTYLAALRQGQAQLTAANQDPSAAQYLLTEAHGWTFTQLVLHYREAMSADAAQAFRQQLDRVAAGEPAQYVLGRANFYGRDFHVTSATLIPRQETEELVGWILTATANTPLQVLDVGTGSGAVAVTLKAERPDWAVTASDLSVAAVAVARTNAQRLAAPITLVTGDLFAPVAGQRFDVIVSNPPYIDRAEMAVMDASVKHYEPEQALYAANHGLAFYQRFATELATYLLPGGQFFAEIGYRQGAAVKAIFETALPAATVTIRTDINGHDRMVRVQL